MGSVSGFQPYSYQAEFARIHPSKNDQRQANSIPESQSPEKNSFADRMLKRLGLKECNTCKNRKYQDVSTDPGVSFKAAEHVSPEASAGAVIAHENQHVQRNAMKAETEGKKIVSQTVQIFTGVCPECGRVYTSGGRTTTVTADNPQPSDKRIDRYV